jgi:NTE family protein
MATRTKRPATVETSRRVPFDRVALLLQGGGALGAYQGGVYQALAEADLHPDWTAGISIGAINAAIIAGNPPEARVERLRGFWRFITDPSSDSGMWFANSDSVRRATAFDVVRQVQNHFSATNAVFTGVAGFYAPRVAAPWMWPPGSPGATSYYDTGPLKTTLERFIDFDRINRREMRFSVGAVNVASGNFIYFDTTTHRICAEHVMASGALPPGFPPIEIEGEHYWDGGLVSNTPLQWVIQAGPRQDTLAFQVDLWNARGRVPRSILDVLTRQKEIQFSSRTRADSDRFKQMQRLRNVLSRLIEQLPESMHGLPEVEILKDEARHNVYNLVQLIYRTKDYEGHSKDYEFSRQSMEEHWEAGYADTIEALRHPEVLERPTNREGVAIFDFE